MNSLGFSLWLALVAATEASASGAATSGADPRFAKAARLYASQQWQQAAELFDQCADLGGPPSRIAALYAVECVAQLRRPEEVQRRLARLVAEESLHEPALQAQALFRLGEAAYLLGQHDRAADALEQFLAAAPQHKSASHARRYLARLAAAEAAQPAADGVDSSAGRSPQLAEGRRLEREGSADAALAAYRQLAQQSDSPSERGAAWRALATLHQRLGQNRDAVEALSQLAEASPPDRAETYLHLANAYRDLGDQARRTETLERIVADDPLSAPAREASYLLAVDAFERRDWPACRRQLAWLNDRLPDEAPPSAPAILALNVETRVAQLRRHVLWLQGQTELETGQWSAAAAAFDRLLAEQPRNLELPALFWRAEAEYRRRDFEAALDRFQRLSARLELAAVTRPGEPEPWEGVVDLRIAQVACHRQEWQETLDLVADLRRRDLPGVPRCEIDYLEGRARAGRGEFAKARAAYQRILDDPQLADGEPTARAAWMIGETYFHQHDLDAAERTFRSVLTDSHQPNWQARAALQAGKCRELAGDWTGAREVYAAAAEKFPHAAAHRELTARRDWLTQQAQRQVPTATRR